jgi:cation diffusion facilitator CzcD-associated flavoprotein CzcO
MIAEQQHTEVAQGPETKHAEVLIVGAGLSGIGAAARLQRDRPGTDYAILEARGAMGGTWDLMRFPGVRSDTDMYTYSYPFRPWPGATSMGQGSDIRDYIRATASEYDVERRIQFDTKVLRASWSSADARWTVEAEVDGRRETWTCWFLFLNTGYYDYEHPYQPHFEGVEDYRGEFLHPQFWPEDLDYAGKRVVVIGSGATAVTMIPAVARTAAHVTMLQRSPSYVMTLPAEDFIANALRRWLPAKLAHRLLRIKNVALFEGLYLFSRGTPRTGRAFYRRLGIRFLKDPAYVDEHFTPAYGPWEQRLTVAPDADFYQAIRAGRASVVTDRIDRFVGEGIRLTSGRVLEADIVASATGLTLKRLGGLELSVDGETIDVSQTVAHRALMLSGVPNLAFSFGYTNNSWTLRSDLSSHHVTRLLRHMDSHGYASAVPTAEPRSDLQPFINDLSSGYIKRGIEAFPRQGERDPWLVRQNYVLDFATMFSGDVTRGVRFARHADVGVPVSAGAPPAG